MVKALFEFFLVVGSEWVLWFLAACSLSTVAVIFDRFRVVRSQEKIGKVFWKDQVDRWLIEGFPKNWRESTSGLSKRYPCVEARLLSTLSSVPLKSISSIERIAKTVLMTERMSLERNLAVLGTLANSAPFIGLFGTVLGIIRAFSELGKSAHSPGLSGLSGGLAEALVTTAAGLLVAIPAAMAYNFFQRKVRTVTLRSASLVDLIQESEGR